MLNKGHGRKVQNTVADNLLPVSGKAMTEALKAKLLWSGSFSSGSITVPNLSEYLVVAVTTSETITAIGFPTSDGTLLIGGILFGEHGTTNAANLKFRFGLSGNSLIINSDNKGCIDNSGSVTATIAIHGLVKKA